MAIVRWEPLRDLMTTQREFDRLFREAFSPALGEGEVSTRTWAPPVDIYENGDNLVLKAELPGVNPDDVEIRVEDNTLYLKGERKFEKEVKEQNYHRVERSYGTFTRTFSLPNSIDSDKVAANLQGWRSDADHAEEGRSEAEDDQDQRQQGRLNDSSVRAGVSGRAAAPSHGGFFAASRALERLERSCRLGRGFCLIETVTDQPSAFS